MFGFFFFFIIVKISSYHDHPAQCILAASNLNSLGELFRFHFHTNYKCIEDTCLALSLENVLSYLEIILVWKFG